MQSFSIKLMDYFAFSSSDSVGRDSGLPLSSEHAELEIERIHDIERVFPDLFV